MKRVLEIILLLVLFCILIFSENEKEVVKVVLNHKEYKLVYYYEFLFKESNVILSVFEEE